MNPRKIETALELKQAGFSYESVGRIIRENPWNVQVAIASTSREKYHEATACEDCGATNEKLNAHHVSYVPEVIKILCMRCHMA